MLVRHTVIALGFSFFVILFGSGHAASPRTLVAKIERLSDGDTLTTLASNQTKLRLHDIDAPEIAHGTRPTFRCSG